MMKSIIAILFSFLLCGYVTADELPWPNVSVVDLGADGWDLDFDPIRRMAYVSIPTLNEIAYVSTETGSIVDRHFVGSRPLGIDYAPHSDRVFVALNQAAAIAEVNPDTRNVQEIVVGGNPGTDNSLIYDVVEARANQVFVSANPGSGGFARIAKVDLANGNTVSTVANNQIIRARPTFQETVQGDVLYVGAGFSPNSLYKLDISQPNAPIVLEDDHGSVSGTQFMDVSPDGDRYYLSSGQVLRTESFLQAGSIGAGIPRLSADGSRAFVRSGGQLKLYDTTTFLQLTSFDLPADFSSIEQFHLLPNDAGLLMLSDNMLLIAVPEPSPLPLSVFAVALLGLVRRR